MESSALRVCARCWGRLPSSTDTCPFCRAAREPSADAETPVARTVHDAAEAWAKTIFGAPKAFEDLIVAIDVRDEVLERVVTEIVRREVNEQRIPCNRRGQSPPRIHPSQVDPFEISVEALRAQSEYVAPCAYCVGAGICHCPACGGACRVGCSNCGGSGKEVKYYKTTTRLINCKVCRASGTVQCGGCGATGSVTCGVCSGSGHQLVWLTYQQESRWTVSVVPASPITSAHPQLAEPRFLNLAELDELATLVVEQADGPVSLQGYRDQDNPALRAVSASLDARLERIGRQQYHRLSVVRRDAHYEMCGTRGSLVLSGRNLIPATTATAVAPLKRRLHAWAAGGALVALGTATLAVRLEGASPYFRHWNPMITLLGGLAAVLAIFALGGLSRALRPGPALRPLRTYEKYAALGGAVLFALMIAVGLIARPRVGEVESALRMGDRAHAHDVVAALEETVGETPEVKDANDAVELADAEAKVGDERLKLLDRVAGRRGKLAATAATAARAERLKQLREMLDARKPAAAIAATDRWWPGSWKSDGELAEVVARAHDIAGADCADAPCRFEEASLARTAAPTAERANAVASARTALLATLVTSDVADGAPLARLQRLRILAGVAKKSVTLAPADDGDLRDAALKTQAWAEAERAKVALIGSEVPMVEELLGEATTPDSRGPSLILEGTRAFLVLDAQKKCRGIYAVGEKEGARPVKLTIAERLLSQATGHASKVNKPQPETATSSRWFATNVMVTARWKSSELIELRIGDAAPF